MAILPNLENSRSTIKNNIDEAMSLAREQDFLKKLQQCPDDQERSRHFLNFLCNQLTNGIWANDFLPILSGYFMSRISKETGLTFWGICPFYILDEGANKQYCWALGFPGKRQPLQCYCMVPQTHHCPLRNIPLNEEIFWTPTITIMLPK